MGNKSRNKNNLGYKGFSLIKDSHLKVRPNRFYSPKEGYLHEGKPQNGPVFKRRFLAKFSGQGTKEIIAKIETGSPYWPSWEKGLSVNFYVLDGGKEHHLGTFTHGHHFFANYGSKFGCQRNFFLAQKAIELLEEIKLSKHLTDKKKTKFKEDVFKLAEEASTPQQLFLLIPLGYRVQSMYFYDSFLHPLYDRLVEKGKISNIDFSAWAREKQEKLNSEIKSILNSNPKNLRGSKILSFISDEFKEVVNPHRQFFNAHLIKEINPKKYAQERIDRYKKEISEYREHKKSNKKK